MRTKTVLLLALLPLLNAAPLSAQTCNDGDTPSTCLFKFIDPIDVSVKTDDVGKMAAKANTGQPDLTKIASTSLRDFLSIFTAAFQTASVEEKDGAYVLDYNLPIDLLNKNDVLKFQGKFAKPELNADLKTALGTNAAAISKYGDALDEADDVTISVTYNPVNHRFGRSLAQHRDLIEGLVRGVSARLQNVTTRSAAQLGNVLRPVLADLISGAAPGQQLSAENQPFSKIKDATQRQQAIDAVVKLGQAAKTQFAAQEKVIVGFAELLSNQEQLYFSGVYHDRDSLAGAGGSSIKGTYEFGGKNLSKLLRNDDSKCDVAKLVDEASQIACLTEFEDYIANQKLRGWRLAVNLDLQQTRANKITIPELTTPLTSKALHSHIVSLTAGRRLNDVTSSRERRIDITGSYEDVTDDPARDNRLVIAATWTQELSDNLTLPITVTYANKERFIGDVNDKFGMHFGISYKIPNPSP